VSAARWAREGSDWLHRRFLAPPAPLAAIEVRARSVGAVRLVSQGRSRTLGGAASVDLPEGCLKLSVSEPNIVGADAFRHALRAVVERAGILGGGRVALVLPDPVARVALLPAADIRGRGAEADELIRFRLRKAVPFEIRSARLASVPVLAPGREPQVLVGAILGGILEEYEGACRALGLEPGLVQLAGLVLLSSIEQQRPPADRVFINWDEGYVSIFLSRDGAPVLIRTLTGADAASAANVLRETSQTVVYYRERLGGVGFAEAVVRSAAIPAAEAVQLLEEPLGRRPEVLDSWGASLAGDPAAAQALAGAAAAVLGTAA
jgi:type IV pilus assembly protein PilM